MSILSELKKISAADRRMIEEAEAMMGPEPDEMGLIKNMFWGRLREDLAFPYPTVSEEEIAKTDALLDELDHYLKNEHPAVKIDQEQEVPEWVIRRLFDMGLMGMTISEEFGGLGLGVTSYNRVLERIGATCASTAVIVSAHQSIGCKAIMLFGTDEQKKRYLPKVATEWVSAFCLSEPNVGCDAGGQETTCRLSEDGSHYILNGEKKWITSGAISDLFTVMANQELGTTDSGKTKTGVTALICEPGMPGLDIFQKNRTKCGIRGTWQARIRFTDVRVPVENRLHHEGKGLKVALSCLNFGRCTLSAGMLGSAARAKEQAIKWSQTRYQFSRPLSDFELVKLRIARMSALCYAMDALLYFMTGMLDRGDADIMVETAATKVFCSEMGWVVVNDAMQIMGGEGYMTENEVERALRDSRINLIVEGANEVMQSFIFAYGGKQLAEQLLSLKGTFLGDEDDSAVTRIAGSLRAALSPRLLSRAVRTGAELGLGWKRKTSSRPDVSESLIPVADDLVRLIRDQSYAFKKTSLKLQEDVVKRQAMQARLSDNFMHLFAMTTVIAKLDEQIKSGGSGPKFEADVAAARHYIELAKICIEENTRALSRNADQSMTGAAEAALDFNDTLPNELFVIPEKSPVAEGTGRTTDTQHIKQFPGDGHGGDGAASDADTLTSRAEA